MSALWSQYVTSGTMHELKQSVMLRLPVLLWAHSCGCQVVEDRTECTVGQH